MPISRSPQYTTSSPRCGSLIDCFFFPVIVTHAKVLDCIKNIFSRDMNTINQEIFEL